jgi:hypothetical protein
MLQKTRIIRLLEQKKCRYKYGTTFSIENMVHHLLLQVFIEENCAYGGNFIFFILSVYVII